MSAKPKVGLIGCGSWGKNHLRVWAEMGNLASVCDPDPARRKEAQATAPGVHACGDIAELLGRSEVSGVIVATPAATHFEVALRALEAGRDVLVEKPLALSVADGKKLVDTAARLGRVLMVGHVLEYHPAVEKLGQLIGDGELGRVQYLYSNRLNFGKIRTEESALWSFAPHDIAIMLRLVGASPGSVASQGGAYLDQQIADATLTTLSFAGPVRGHIFVSWLHPFKEHRFVVVCDRQMAVFDDTMPWDEKLVLYPHRVDWIQGRIPVAHKASGVRVPLVEAEPLRRECEHFLASIESRRPARTDGVSGLEVLRVLAAAQASLESGGRPAPIGPSDPSSPDYHAHASAVIDKGAMIGAGTRIWHWSHVMGRSTIGRNCVLGQNVFVAPNVVVGDGVKIQNNVSLYEGVTLEDHVFCGPSMVFTNVINPRSAIERKNEFRPTRVGRGATLGANSTIVCGHDIGRYAFVAAGAVVTRAVPDHALVVGAPARRVAWVCECAEKLVFSGSAAKCAACGLSYVQLGADRIQRA